MITLSEENYLKAIFHLVDANNQVTVNEISKFLSIKMPSVNSMMKKFAEKGWVIYESYKPLILTKEGKVQAAQVVRKHRLTEMFLVEKMGFGWEEVHDIAEQIEHIKSERFFDKIDELLHYPKVDPHGSPIPDKNGTIIENNYKKLSECRENQVVIFKSISESTKEFLNYLNQKELALEVEIHILEKDDFDKTLLVAYEDRKEKFSQIVSEKLLVKSKKPE